MAQGDCSVYIGRTGGITPTIGSTLDDYYVSANDKWMICTVANNTQFLLVHIEEA